MQISETPDGNPELFDDAIDGFTFADGTSYLIDVTIEEIENPTVHHCATPSSRSSSRSQRAAERCLRPRRSSARSHFRCRLRQAFRQKI